MHSTKTVVNISTPHRSHKSPSSASNLLSQSKCTCLRDSRSPLHDIYARFLMPGARWKSQSRCFAVEAMNILRISRSKFSRMLVPNTQPLSCMTLYSPPRRAQSCSGKNGLRPCSLHERHLHSGSCINTKTHRRRYWLDHWYWLLCTRAIAYVGSLPISRG